MRFIYNTIGLMVISGPEIMLSSSVGLVAQCPPITDDTALQQQVDRVLGMDLNSVDRNEICRRLRQIKEEQEGLKTTLRAIERAVNIQKLRERITSICPGNSLGNEELRKGDLDSFRAEWFDLMDANERQRFCNLLRDPRRDFRPLIRFMHERVEFMKLVQDAQQNKGEGCDASTQFYQLLNDAAMTTGQELLKTAIIWSNFIPEEEWILCEIWKTWIRNPLAYQSAEGLRLLRNRYLKRVHGGEAAWSLYPLIILCQMSIPELNAIRAAPLWHSSLNWLVLNGSPEDDILLPIPSKELIKTNSQLTTGERIKTNELGLVFGRNLLHDEKSRLCALARERGFDRTRLYQWIKRIVARYSKDERFVSGSPSRLDGFRQLIARFFGDEELQNL